MAKKSRVLSVLRWLLAAGVFGVFITTGSACNKGPKGDGDQQEVENNVEAVWKLVEDFSASKNGVDCDKLDEAFKNIDSDDGLKMLSEKGDDENRFAPLFVKGKQTAKCPDILDKFLDETKIGAQNVKEQLKTKNKKATQILMETRPDGEDEAHRNKTLAVVLSNAPDDVNDLMDKNNKFDDKLFNNIAASLKPGKTDAVIKSLKAPNRDGWVSWVFANKTDGQANFKKIFGAVDVSRKTDLHNALWSSVRSNYAEVKSLVEDMTPGKADTWGFSALLSSRINDIVVAQYGEKGASGKADFKALYTALAALAPDQKAMRDKLWALTSTTWADVQALTADMAGPDAWGIKGTAGDLLDKIVAQQYANAGGGGDADFQALYAALGNAEQTAMRAKLWALSSTSWADVQTLTTDIAGANNWGIQATVNDLLDGIVAVQYANRGAGGKGDFRALYDALVIAGNATDPGPTAMRTKLITMVSAVPYTDPAGLRAFVANDLIAGNPYGIRANCADQMPSIVQAQFANRTGVPGAATGEANFNALYAAAGPANKGAMRAQLWAEVFAVSPLAADIDTFRTTKMGNAPGQWNVFLNDNEYLRFVVGRYHALGDKVNFAALYNLPGLAIKKPIMRAKLWDMAKPAGAGTYMALTKPLVDDISGPNGWGIRADVNGLLHDIVIAQYAEKGTTGKADFKALYNALAASAVDQADMRTELWAASSTAYADVKALTTDIAGPDDWGIKATVNDLLAPIVTEQFAHRGPNGGEADFNALHAALLASVNDQKTMRAKLWDRAYAAAPTGVGAAAFVGTLGNGPGQWDVKAQAGDFVIFVVIDHYNNTHAAEFRALYNGLNDGGQKLMRNNLVAFAYDYGRMLGGNDGSAASPFDAADYLAAITHVGQLITDGFFDAAEAVGNTFDPEWIGMAPKGHDSRLLWAVLDKAAADLAGTAGLLANNPNKYLDEVMVNRMAAPLKLLFAGGPIDPSSGAGGGAKVGAPIAWSGAANAYLDAADNEGGPNKSIVVNLVEGNIATAVGNGAYALPMGVASNNDLAKHAHWLDY